ncbi:hypothetical protein TPAR_00834 [Tolypocladium paradoxum]|uniref:Uncharacterized protein n=1 Tax=Tolypocladium paradoxum TaxID=94208 RepID=A0A2S4L955_9HYPO|nr:hypothetical protein TPAR_00834 [Tolypocladium paradoxum]
MGVWRTGNIDLHPAVRRAASGVQQGARFGGSQPFLAATYAVTGIPEMDTYTAEERQRRISELIRECVKEEEELAKLEEFIEKLPNTDQVRKSGSRSRSQRTGLPDALSRDELLQKSKEDRAKRMENIGLLWKKINALQAEDRASN